MRTTIIAAAIIVTGGIAIGGLTVEGVDGSRRSMNIETETLTGAAEMRAVERARLDKGELMRQAVDRMLAAEEPARLECISWHVEHGWIETDYLSSKAANPHWDGPVRSECDTYWVRGDVK